MLSSVYYTNTGLSVPPRRTRFLDLFVFLLLFFFWFPSVWCMHFLKCAPRTGRSPPARTWVTPSRGRITSLRRAILFIKPRGVLILSNGTTLLIHARFLIHNHHKILWAELLLTWLFLLVTGRCSACLVLLPVVSWVWFIWDHFSNL